MRPVPQCISISTSSLLPERGAVVCAGGEMAGELRFGLVPLARQVQGPEARVARGQGCGRLARVEVHGNAQVPVDHRRAACDEAQQRPQPRPNFTRVRYMAIAAISATTRVWREEVRANDSNKERKVHFGVCT